MEMLLKFFSGSMNKNTFVVYDLHNWCKISKGPYSCFHEDMPLFAYSHHSQHWKLISENIFIQAKRPETVNFCYALN